MFIRTYTVIYMEVIVRFKTSKKLKAAALKKVKRLGITFSDVMNGKLREYVKRGEITFSAKPLRS